MPSFISDWKEVYSLKYKDYLILPVLIMYLLYASCAYIARTENEGDGKKTTPVAVVDPAVISWGDAEGEYGECWYAEGARGTSYFMVAASGRGEPSICFYNNSSIGKHNDFTESSCVVADKHMRCTNNGIRYDLIFVNEMTAYDLISGTYYQRGDYKLLKAQLTAGKFVNAENPNHYYVFKENGKSVEYAGDKVFKGKALDDVPFWQLFERREPKSIPCYDLLARFDVFQVETRVIVP